MPFDFEKALADATNEETKEVDVKALKAAIDNDYVNPIVAKNKPDMEALKAEASESAIGDFIKGLKLDGVENVDQFNAHVKRLGASSTELTEANQRLTGDLAARDASIEDLTGKLGEATALNAAYADKAVIGEAFDSDFIDDVYTLAKSQVTEDNPLPEVLKSIGEKYPDWVKGADRSVRVTPRNKQHRQEQDPPKKNPYAKFY